ncbi:hypothetical protein TREMEDRAFT_61700 [Tremella mesenterica DSM 1558]|uniref:uncharacterized protein n=1 Tax=Tremella mesenterica (strain ATCC 24925 / CBS 8224 / DSM 1558 / NBRC 9311 / NRRL Y-6157 / RJB 2259-6 / UBC 559-6) TaxID=578456 RepID=UPI0003F48F6A|nr:uncharacterized protein TREMEDRAFT_61700 [Tremella mesenterica DSM 1558]EIW69928.1 hypothetical protein TREMEDRAFT_61700 [Tremella mesenterica DSM 1558]
MRLFSRRKKSNTPAVQTPELTPLKLVKSLSGTSKVGFGMVFPSRLTSSTTRPHVVPEVKEVIERKMITLRVLVDDFNPGKTSMPFLVEVDGDGDIGDLRRAIVGHIGEHSMSLFKVSIPLDAHSQAITYVKKYNTSVDLLTAFPSFNLDDPAQLAISRALGRWHAPVTMSEPEVDPILKINDWFSDSSGKDVIDVLVRIMPGSSADIPLTILAHFASSDSPRQRTSTPTPKPTRRPPTCLTVSSKSTINELKRCVLLADGRPALPELAEQIILWRVDMSEEEMIVIEDRGGLKDGQMPWPYPPTAPVPISLSDPDQRIDQHFLEEHSNVRMVSLSIWIPPSIAYQLSRPTSNNTIEVPVFRYPMNFETPSVSLCTESRPSITPVRPKRHRPSTAPASVVHPITSRSASLSSVPITPITPITPKERKGERIRHSSYDMRPTLPSPLSAPIIPTAGGWVGGMSHKMQRVVVGGSDQGVTITQSDHRRHIRQSSSGTSEVKIGKSYETPKTRIRESFSSQVDSDIESPPELTLSKLSFSSDISEDIQTPLAETKGEWLFGSSGSNVRKEMIRGSMSMRGRSESSPYRF